MMVLDASLLVSYMIPNDVHHNQAMTWIQKTAAKSSFLIPAIAIIEITCVLSRNKTEETLRDHWVLWVQNFLSVAGSDDSLSSPSMAEIIHAAKKTGCRAGDVFYVALAKKHSIPLVSFDKDQLAKSSKFGVQVIEP